MKDIATKERFVELRASGQSYARISVELGVSKTTLVEWSRSMATEISNLKAVELDAVLEKSFAAKAARVSLFQEILEKLVTEIRARQFTNMSDERLLDLILKYGGALAAENQPASFCKVSGYAEMFPPDRWDG